MNRIISLSVEDMYIKYTGEAFGATGSHNAVTLRMTFGPAWEGTAKTAYFTDALGNTSVALVLGLDTLVDGAYEVDVPSEALKTAGVATITIKGVLVSGETTIKAITTAAGHFRVLDSELPDSAGNAGTITPSDKDQLQAEIAGMETLFTTAKAAAEAAAANAKASETAAASSASSAEASKTAAAESSATAAASANTAGSAAAAAVKNASHAAESAKAAENTAKSIVTEEVARQAAEKVRQANETARQNAESARQTAETTRTQAETARNVWEDYDSAKNYQPGNKIYWQGSSYVCLKACSGISPENGRYWQLVVRSGFTSDSAFGFDVVNGRLLCYYSGDNPPPFRLGDDGHLYVDLDKTYDLGKVTGGSGSGGGVDIDLGMTGAAAGQVAKVKAVDTDGKPTAWEPADLPGGGGNEWVKVAETTLTEIVNEIRLNFDPCKAVYIEFQYGAVEDDLGVIGIYPNPQTPIYTAEKRSCAAYTTTSATNKRGYIFCTIDRRKGTQWVATSQIFYRSELTFGSIKPGESMNCDIDIFNNNTWASVLWKPKLVGTDYINSVSAFGAGMNIGTTLTVWGIKV